MNSNPVDFLLPLSGSQLQFSLQYRKLSTTQKYKPRRASSTKLQCNPAALFMQCNFSSAEKLKTLSTDI